jgi:hypothetical protein
MRTTRAVVAAGAVMLAGAAVAAAAGEEVAFQRSEIQAPDPCPDSSEVRGYQVRVGRASGKLFGKNEAKTINAARSYAFDQLEEVLCTSTVSAARCHASVRNIAPYGSGEYNRKENTACASVAISTEWLNSIERDLSALEASLADLSDGIKARAGDAAVQLAEPIWSVSGCSAGEVGAHLLNTLKSQMAGARVLDPGDTAPDMREVRLELSTDGSRVRLSAAMRRQDEVAWTLLDIGGRSFPRDLFQTLEGEDGECRSDNALGLEGGSRPGSTGAWARLEIPASPHGIYCEGEEMQVSMMLNRASQVRLYTVQADGEGYLVYSSMGQAMTFDALKGGIFREPWTVTRTFDGSDTQLVVAVTPPGASFGSEEAVTSMCRLKAPLHAD